MNQIFRNGTTDDIDQLIELGLLSYGQFKPLLSPDNWQKMQSNISRKKFYEGLLAISDCFVCEEKEKIVGMIFLVRSGNPTSVFQNDWSYIRMLGVKPEKGGKGLGRKLTEMCIAKAKAEKQTTIALHTSEIMLPAIHIYEGLGFVRIREIPRSLGLTYWLYTLSL